MSASDSVAVRIGYAAPGKLTVAPSTVRVEMGQSIRWVLVSHADEPVEFGVDLHGSPFEYSQFEQWIVPSGTGVINAGPATRPGDYKYDVKVRDSKGQPLADDDPHIIVLPRKW